MKRIILTGYLPVFALMLYFNFSTAYSQKNAPVVNDEKESYRILSSMCDCDFKTNFLDTVGEPGFVKKHAAQYYWPTHPEKDSLCKGKNGANFDYRLSNNHRIDGTLFDCEFLSKKLKKPD